MKIVRHSWTNIQREKREKKVDKETNIKKEKRKHREKIEKGGRNREWKRNRDKESESERY